MVGAVAVPVGFDWAVLPGVTDSKKLSEKKREVIFENAQGLQNDGKLFFAVAGESAATIDGIGIVPAIRQALARALEEIERKILELHLALPRTVLGENNLGQVAMVKLDGGLKAPASFVHQETIIKGDAKEPVIGLASIVAKVTRDREMVELAAQYPGYGMEVHKGYGTKAHREAVRCLGLSPVHRASFCRNCQIKKF